MGKKIKDSVFDKLDPRLLPVLLIMSIFEFELFTFANGLIAVVGRDLWLSILLGTVFLFLNTYILVKLATRFPKENLFQYIQKIWGKPLGVLITICYLLYWLVFLIVLFSEFSKANQIFFLRETPLIIPMVLMAFGAIWIISYGLPAIIRLFQIIFPFMIIYLVIVVFFAITDIRLSNFLPIASQGFLPIIKGSVLFLGFFQGLEVLLFVIPFLAKPTTSLKPAFWGIAITFFFAFTLGSSAIGILGLNTAKEFAWPGIATISVVEFPGFPVERYELSLTLPWLFGTFTTMCIFLYLLVYGIFQLFSFKASKLLSIIMVFVIISGTYLIPNQVWQVMLRNLVNQVSLLFIAVIPTVSLILAIIRGKEGIQGE